jgi:hypothetical protein
MTDREATPPASGQGATSPANGRDAAHAVVAAFAQESGAGAWRLDRAAVADRLHVLIDTPGAIRQGSLNLCGPAAVFTVWLRHSPVAAVTYAARLFADGATELGRLPVTASAALRRVPYPDSHRAQRCPQADWMMMSALRDTTNRVLPYASISRWREPVAGITLPGAVRLWLSATGLFSVVRDETNPLLRKGMRHAYQLPVGGGTEVLALIAMEMLRRPASRLRRARDLVVALVPNHWVVLRSPVVRTAEGRVRVQLWTWGEEYSVELPESRFRRCYFGALVGRK